MGAGRIVLLIVGVVAALISLAFLAGGVVLLVVNHTQRDAAGYFSTGDETFRTETPALVATNLDVGTGGPDRLFDEGRLGTVRLQGSNEDPSRDIFIGVAPTAEVVRYLDGSGYDKVTDLELDPFSVTYERASGSSTLAPPSEAGFWAASASGAGLQTVHWDLAKGDWSVVVMNADASPGVVARLSIGAKTGLLQWLGIGLLIVGGIVAVAAVLMIVFALRRRRAPRAPTAPSAATAPSAPSAATAPSAPPAPSAVPAASTPDHTGAAAPLEARPPG
jgi:hypothetical protein